ncbi:unnamed protein product [Calicophoron daubneyi]|uniref:Protein rolling stone n=1 Tax=Calicophoron daubneyi TaxID=300641 RepID=A0AAV2TA13_CALDB
MSGNSSKPSFWRCFCLPRLHDFFIAEFSLHGLGLNYFRTTDFVTSQWSWMKPWIFTTYRVIVALGMLVWISFDIPTEIHRFYKDQTAMWFVYVTNWAFGLLTLVLFTLAIYTLVYNCPPRDNTTVVFYQPIWLLYTVAANAMLVTCIVYWVALSDSDLGVLTSMMGKLKHSLSGAVVLVDIILSAIPFRLLHVVYPLLFGLIYSVFTYVFWLANGYGPFRIGQVYPGLNWSRPRTAILVCLCAILICFLVQIVIYLIYFLRVKLSQCNGGRGYSDNTLKGKSGYGEIGQTLRDQANKNELISVTSMTTLAEPITGPEYGTVVE